MTIKIKSTYSLHYYTLHLSYIHYSSVSRIELTRNAFNWSVFRSAIQQLTSMLTSVRLFPLSFFFFSLSSSSVFLLLGIPEFRQLDFRQYELSPMAKFHCAFANIPSRLSSIGEIPIYFRQYTLMTFVNWRNSNILSPIYPHDFRQLAKFHCTFANTIYKLKGNAKIFNCSSCRH